MKGCRARGCALSSLLLNLSGLGHSSHILHSFYSSSRCRHCQDPHTWSRSGNPGGFQETPETKGGQAHPIEPPPAQIRLRAAARPRVWQEGVPHVPEPDPVLPGSRDSGGTGFQSPARRDAEGRSRPRGAANLPALATALLGGHRLPDRGLQGPRDGAQSAPKGSRGQGGPGKPREGRTLEKLRLGGEGATRGASPDRDPHRPWRRNLRFLRPKMRTLEKISTRLPLQSPRFLLGLLRLLLADGRSQCCSRACRFWRIKPLAMAAAMVAPGMGPGREGAGGLRAGGTGGEGGGADRGSHSGQRRGRQAGIGRGEGALSPDWDPSPSPRGAGPGAQMRPGRSRTIPGSRRSWPPPLGHVRVENRTAAAGAAGHRLLPEPWRGSPLPLALPSRPARLPGGR